MEVPEGFALVPIEPTEEMLLAAGAAMKNYIEALPIDERSKRKGRGYKVAPRIKSRLRWQAMVAAAPQA